MVFIAKYPAATTPLEARRFQNSSWRGVGPKLVEEPHRISHQRSTCWDLGSGVRRQGLSSKLRHIGFGKTPLSYLTVAFTLFTQV